MKLLNTKKDKRVYLSDTSPYCGTQYPVGTRAYPVNNLDDAIAIKKRYGCNEICAEGNFTFKKNSLDDCMFMIGRGHGRTTFHVHPNVSSRIVYFKNAALSGVLDQFCRAINCLIGDMEVNSGHVEDSVLGGIISGNSHSMGSFSGCVQQPNSTVIFDLHGVNFIWIRDYTGAVIMINAGTGNLLFTSSMSFTSGSLTIDDSCIGGYIWISGIVAVDDYSAGTVVDTKKVRGTHVIRNP